jgi:hypothetical protein
LTISPIAAASPRYFLRKASIETTLAASPVGAFSGRLAALSEGFGAAAGGLGLAAGAALAGG